MQCCEYPGCILNASSLRRDTRRKVEEWLQVCHDHRETPLPPLEVDTYKAELDGKILDLVRSARTMHWTTRDVAREVGINHRDAVIAVQRCGLKTTAGRIVRPTYTPPQQDQNMPRPDETEPHFERLPDEPLRDFTLRLVTAHPGLTAKQYNARARRKVAPRLSSLSKSGELIVDKSEGLSTYRPAPKVESEQEDDADTLPRLPNGEHTPQSWSDVMDDLQRIIDTAEPRRAELVEKLRRIDADVNAANTALAGLQAIVGERND